MRSAKAQPQHIFTFIMAALVVILIVVVGFNVISMFSRGTCQTELKLFKEKITSMNAEIGVGEGIQEREFDTPCRAERVIFIDMDNPVSPRSFGKYPIIQDAIEDGVEKNVFIIRNKAVRDAFYMGSVDIRNPYFTCFLTAKGRLSLRMEGHGIGSEIIPKRDIFSCTFEGGVLVEMEKEDLEDLIDEIKEDLGADDEIVDPLLSNLTREIKQEGNESTIKIKKKRGEFRYFEKIPKCAIEDLEEAIEDGLIDIEGWETIEKDPIIAWDFSSGEEEAEYTINKIIEESCKKEFGGVGVGTEGQVGIDSGDAEGELSDEEQQTVEDREDTLEQIIHDIQQDMQSGAGQWRKGGG